MARSTRMASDLWWWNRRAPGRCKVPARYRHTAVVGFDAHWVLPGHLSFQLMSARFFHRSPQTRRSPPGGASVARCLVMVLMCCLFVQALSLSVQRTQAAAHRHVDAAAEMAGSMADSMRGAGAMLQARRTMDWRAQFKTWLRGADRDHFAVHQPAFARSLGTALGSPGNPPPGPRTSPTMEAHFHTDLQRHTHGAEDTTAVYVPAEDGASKAHSGATPKRAVLDLDSLAAACAEVPATELRPVWPSAAMPPIRSRVTQPLERPPQG
jgi:hypothetical protein